MIKKSKKGFTLIELLAVIVILAIIALIATPIIVGVINKSKKNAFMDTAYGVLEAGKLYYAKNFGNDDFAGKTITFPSDAENLKLSGEKPGGGTLEITSKGKQVLAIYDKGENWCASKGEEDSKILVTKYEEGKCKIEVSNPFPTLPLPAGLTKGTPVYLNPETKKTCNAEEAVSITGRKTGCMKWYVYKGNENRTYQLILDHNTTAKVAWNSSNTNKEMKEIATALTNDTRTWNPTLKARLITAGEIAGITGNTSFNEATATYDKWFYFDSNTQTQTATSKGMSKYAWLYDYTDGCIPYGCNIADNATSGYWTSTPAAGSSDYVWNVYKLGHLGRNHADNVFYTGVRPIITV